MQEPITGFHQDDIGDWIADLACGHTRHVRHNPPWMERPWVLTPDGREAMIGRLVTCKMCDDERGVISPPCDSPMEI